MGQVGRQGSLRQLPGAVPPEEIEEKPANKNDADRHGKKHRTSFEREPIDAVDGSEAERQAEQGEGDIGRDSASASAA